MVTPRRLLLFVLLALTACAAAPAPPVATPTSSTASAPMGGSAPASAALAAQPVSQFEKIVLPCWDGSTNSAMPYFALTSTNSPVITYTGYWQGQYRVFVKYGEKVSILEKGVCQ